ncbi:bifunctional folylpolyglutamate synthase/dihydrofolate synthase [bacterium]|nr:bifunctional folylpolyglutamate synthase/dihydrofolate synthase [bacterium]
MSQVSTYEEALRFLYSFIDYERHAGWKYDTVHFNLDRYRDYLHALGSPHEHGRYVHVAGTNGKGSVCAMIDSVLREAGLKTGLYTSPHLITFRERIRQNGVCISCEEVVKSVNRIKEITGRFESLTFFEVWTALAFDYFARNDLDVTVLEVGMGGRLDSTNVIEPDVSVITSISMDHRGKLGDTPEQIAREKAGIIKPGIPVISAPQDGAVLGVLESKAREAGAQLVIIGRDVQYDIASGGINYSGTRWTLDNVHIQLNGAMQYENTAVSLAALEVLSQRGYPVNEDTAREGIRHVKWPGRLQHVTENPIVVVDGACNTGAMKMVHEYISSLARRERVVALVGMCRDKDVRDVLEILGKTASRFVLTQVNNPRAMDADELAGHSPGTVTKFVEKNPTGALDRAIELAGENGLVIATGSLYLVGEILRRYSIEEFDDVVSAAS